MRAYRALIGGTFRKMLAYRLRYVTGIVSYLVYVTTNHFIWKAAYAGQKPAVGGASDGAGGAATIGGLTAQQMAGYVAVGWVARSFYFNNVDREIAEQVQNGTIAVALSRPVSFQGSIVATSLGEALFRFFFFTLPIGAAIFLLFPVPAPASALHAAAFVLSLCFANLILTHINFLVGMAAFPLKNIDGVMRAKHYLIEILSGLLVPVSFFPGWLWRTSRFLPFASIGYAPNQIWLGTVSGSGLWRTLAEQAFWVAALAALCAMVWRRAARRLSLQGG